MTMNAIDQTKVFSLMQYVTEQVNSLKIVAYTFRHCVFANCY